MVRDKVAGPIQQKFNVKMEERFFSKYNGALDAIKAKYGL